eukprot:1014420-Rhodomonas_salina.1
MPRWLGPRRLPSRLVCGATRVWCVCHCRRSLLRGVGGVLLARVRARVGACARSPRSTPAFL